MEIMMDKKVTVEQVASVIRRNKKQLLWLKSLGLGGIGKQSILPDNASTQGLIRKLRHCVRVK